MAQPKADPPKCDVFGCGHLASKMTDGTETDIQASWPQGTAARKAVPYLNVCDSHENWPFSQDAQVFAASSEKYRDRAASQAPPESKKVRV